MVYTQGKRTGFPLPGKLPGPKSTAKSRTKALKKNALNTFMSVWR